MKRPLLFSLFALIVFFLVTLFLQNGDSLEIEFLIWRFNLTIAQLTVLAFSSGFLIGALLFVPMWIKKRSLAAKLQQQLNGQNQDIDDSLPSSAELNAKSTK
ncbi:LapA family protein [bacterium]|nr:MAG: LapA family protein [bacterium]